MLRFFLPGVKLCSWPRGFLWRQQLAKHSNLWNLKVFLQWGLTIKTLGFALCTSVTACQKTELLLCMPCCWRRPEKLTAVSPTWSYKISGLVPQTEQLVFWVVAPTCLIAFQLASSLAQIFANSSVFLASPLLHHLLALCSFPLSTLAWKARVASQVIFFQLGHWYLQ